MALYKMVPLQAIKDAFYSCAEGAGDHYESCPYECDDPHKETIPINGGDLVEQIAELIERFDNDKYLGSYKEASDG